jgi:hypothetical protein
MKIGLFKEKYKTALMTFRTYQETKADIQDTAKRLKCSDSDIIALAVHIMAKRTTSDLLTVTHAMYQEQFIRLLDEGNDAEK